MANLIQLPGGAAGFDGRGVEYYGVREFSRSAEGAGAADSFDLVFQLTDPRGADVKKAGVGLIVTYSTDAPTGGTLTGATTGSGITTAGTAAIAIPFQNNRIILLPTDANGRIAVRLNIVGASTRRIYIMFPDGRTFESTLITFAA